MKYINHTQYGLVLFSRHLTHVDMANLIGCPDEIKSAGFVEVLDKEELRDNMYCTGSSSSLKKRAREKDTDLLFSMLHSIYA